MFLPQAMHGAPCEMMRPRICAQTAVRAHCAQQEAVSPQAIAGQSSKKLAICNEASYGDCGCGGTWPQMHGGARDV